MDTNTTKYTDMKNFIRISIAAILFAALFLITGSSLAQDPTETPTAESGDGSPSPTVETAQSEATPTPVPEKTEKPPTIPTAISHPVEGDTNLCFDCHIELDEEEHATVAVEWEDSVHGKAGVICADCHGGDPTTDEMNASMDPAIGFIGAPDRQDIPAICGGCHSDASRMGPYNLSTDQYSKYITSVHGSKIAEGDTRVAICTDCHGSHDVKKTSDPSADAYILNIPELCASCHSDASLMEPYGLPTDQLDVYKESVHGEKLIGDQDFRAPTCASCHGSHGAKPPLAEEVINVCGKCHTATQAYYEQSLHSRIGEAAPKCWTCHGTHDITQAGEYMFFHSEPVEQQCGSCHLDEENFRMDRTRFELPEDRRCDTCHHPESWVMTQVDALWSALSEAADAYNEADEAITEAASRGMIVNDAHVKLAEAYTSLVSARATLHTTKLTAVTDLTDAAVIAANESRDIATAKLNENNFRRQAMIVVVLIIVFNIGTLKLLERRIENNESIF